MAYRSGCIPVGACAFGAEGLMTLCCRTGQRLRRCRSGGKGLGRRLQKEGAPVWIKPLQPGFARGKQANRPSGVGNAPLLPTAPPPEGEVLAALCLVMLMSSEGKRRADFPLRGKWCAAPIGVHFRRAPARFACFSTPARAVVWFYHKRRLT